MDETQIDFDCNDFLDCFGPLRGGYKFIGKYSREEIENIIRNSPISASLERAGFDDWYVEMELNDTFNHYLYVRSRRISQMQNLSKNFRVENNEKNFESKTIHINNNEKVFSENETLYKYHSYNNNNENNCIKNDDMINNTEKTDTNYNDNAFNKTNFQNQRNVNENNNMNSKTSEGSNESECSANTKDKYLMFVIIRVDKRPTLKVTSHTPEMITFITENPFLDFFNLDLLNVQWLSLQNPLASFTRDRPRLPGQRHPGSGFGKSVFSVMRRLCILSGRDGIVNIPEHFHNAYMYVGFFFIDPMNQAHFDRIKRDLRDDIQNKGLAAVSWAIGIGALRLEGMKETYYWTPGEQIYPLSRRTFAYFNSVDYTDKVYEYSEKLPKFEIDWKSVGNLVDQLS